MCDQDTQPTPPNSDSDSFTSPTDPTIPATPEETKVEEAREDKQSLADRIAALQHPDYPHNLDPEYVDKSKDPFAAPADNSPLYRSELENALANQRADRLRRGVPSASDIRENPGSTLDVVGSHQHSMGSISPDTAVYPITTEGITPEDVQEAMAYLGMHNPKPEIPLHLTVTGHEIVAIARMFRRITGIYAHYPLR